MRIKTLLLTAITVVLTGCTIVSEFRMNTADISTKDHVMSIIDSYISQNDNYKNCLENKDYIGASECSELKERVEKYGKEMCVPAMKKGTEFVCAEHGAMIVDKMIELIISSQNFSEEDFANELGKAYICSSDAVKEGFKKVSEENKLHVYDNIVFGFLNKADREAENYQALKQDLMDMWPDKSKLPKHLREF